MVEVEIDEELVINFYEVIHMVDDDELDELLHELDELVEYI